MAGTNRPHPTEPSPGAENTPLSAAEVTDSADTAARAPEADLSGKRVRAIPAKGGTTIVVDAQDFANNGIKHPKVTFDFRKDNFTLAVGEGKPLSKEAADFLTSFDKSTFEYLDQ